MLPQCALTMEIATKLELENYLDDFIKNTEELERLVDTYDYMGTNEKTTFWLKTANLFSALRLMLSRWGLTELCKAFIEGCGGLIEQLEAKIANVDEMRREIEKSQKKWSLNAKFQKLVDDRDEKELKRTREQILTAKQMGSSQASTLRVHIEASVSSRFGSTSTQSSSDAFTGSQPDADSQDPKRRRL